MVNFSVMCREGTEGSRDIVLMFSLTSALDGVGW
jgi:hypothetical protein